MVLFTSGPLTNWGNLQMPWPASPPGICLLSFPNNQFPTSLQKSYDDWTHLLLKQGRKVEEGFGYPMRELQHLSHLNCLDLPGHSPAELISVSSFKVWGNTRDPQHEMAYLLVCLGNTTEERQYSVSLVWVNRNQTRASTMEEVVEKLATCPSQWNWLALCPGTIIWGFWSCTTPQGQTSGHPSSRKGGGNLLWADQSTWHLPAPFCWLPSGQSLRFEQTWWTHYNHSTRTTKQWYECYCQQASLPGDRHPSQWAIRHQGSAYWWGLNHPDNQPA